MPNPGPHFDPVRPGQKQLSPKAFNDLQDQAEKSNRTMGGVGALVSTSPLGSAIQALEPPSFWAQLTGLISAANPAEYSCVALDYNGVTAAAGSYADPPATSVVEINGIATAPINGTAIVRAVLSADRSKYVFSFSGSAGGGGGFGSTAFWARVTGPIQGNGGYKFVELKPHPTILGDFADLAGGRTDVSTGLNAFPAMAFGPVISGGVASQIPDVGVGANQVVGILWLASDSSCYQFIVPFRGSSWTDSGAVTASNKGGGGTITSTPIYDNVMQITCLKGILVSRNSPGNGVIQLQLDLNINGVTGVNLMSLDTQSFSVVQGTQGQASVATIGFTGSITVLVGGTTISCSAGTVTLNADTKVMTFRNGLCTSIA